MPRASAFLDPSGPRWEAVCVSITGLAAVAVLLFKAARRVRPLPFPLYRGRIDHG